MCTCVYQNQQFLHMQLGEIWGNIEANCSERETTQVLGGGADMKDS